MAQLDSGAGAGLLARTLGAMQGWMMGVIKTHGFLGILMLASWPNAAFDLCGICCGHFQMPFWQFFGATFIGKALLKVSVLWALDPSGQWHALLRTILRRHLIGRALLKRPAPWPPDSRPCEHTAVAVLHATQGFCP